jgi:ABC-type transporter Mla subunit MlaD
MRSADVTGLAVALTAAAKARAHQLSRDLQAASRTLDRAGHTLTEARRTYARAAADYRTLYEQALGTWTVDELAAAGAKPPPPNPKPHAHPTAEQPST